MASSCQLLTIVYSLSNDARNSTVRVSVTPTCKGLPKWYIDCHGGR